MKQSARSSAIDLRAAGHTAQALGAHPLQQRGRGTALAWSRGAVDAVGTEGILGASCSAGEPMSISSFHLAHLPLLPALRFYLDEYRAMTGMVFVRGEAADRACHS